MIEECTTESSMMFEAIFRSRGPCSIASSSESSAEATSNRLVASPLAFLVLEAFLLLDGPAAVALRTSCFFFPLLVSDADGADLVLRGPYRPASISASSESDSSACSRSTSEMSGSFFFRFEAPLMSRSLTLTKPFAAAAGTFRMGSSSRLRFLLLGDPPFASEDLREVRSSRTYSSISISISTHSGSISSGIRRSTSPYTSRSEARTMKC